MATDLFVISLQFSLSLVRLQIMCTSMTCKTAGSMSVAIECIAELLVSVGIQETFLIRVW